MELENPYSVGRASAAVPRYSGEIASKGRRFGTFCVDYAVYFAISAALGAFVAITIGLSAAQGANAYLISIPAFVIYYVGFETLVGRTPGKFIFGTRVITEHGDNPSFGQACGRTLSRMIPFEPFSVLFSSSGLGWHDTIASTKVVRVRR